MRYTILFSILMLLAFAGCQKDKFSSTPSLKYKSENTRVVQSGQELTFTLSFTDAEGDLTDSLILSKVVGNCPIGSAVELYGLPSFPTSKDQKGDILVNFFYNVNGLNTIGSPQCSQNDTAVFKFVLRDKAQHYSDTATSPPIVIIHQ